MARECYQDALASGKNHTWIINELKPIHEPLETPQEVKIVLGDLMKVLNIRTTLPTSKKEKMISFLRANQDSFPLPRID